MAILVVILHVRLFENVSMILDYAFVQGFTRVAVPFFFVSSGFLLFKKLQLENIALKPIRKYCLKILRIYCVWTLIYIPFIIRDMSKDNEGYMHAALKGIRDLLFVGYAHLWFLPALIIGVLITAYLLQRKCKINTIVTCGGILYIAALGGYSYYGVFTYFCPEGSLLFTIVHYLSLIIVTPRNGLFMGFLYVALGASIAFHKKIYTKKYLFSGFLLSWMLFFSEAMLVHSYDLMLSNGDAYVSLIPVSFFTFLLGISIKLKDDSIYIWLRKMSMFIYYVHFWFINVIEWISFHIIGLGSLEKFAGVIICSVITAIMIIILSNHYKFLKILY